VDAFSRLKKNMAAQKYEASSTKKGKTRNPKKSIIVLFYVNDEKNNI